MTNPIKGCESPESKRGGDRLSDGRHGLLNQSFRPAEEPASSGRRLVLLFSYIGQDMEGLVHLMSNIGREETAGNAELSGDHDGRKRFVPWEGIVAKSNRNLTAVVNHNTHRRRLIIAKGESDDLVLGQRRELDRLGPVLDKVDVLHGGLHGRDGARGHLECELNLWEDMVGSIAEGRGRHQR